MLKTNWCVTMRKEGDEFECNVQEFERINYEVKDKWLTLYLRDRAVFNLDVDEFHHFLTLEDAELFIKEAVVMLRSEASKMN